MVKDVQLENQSKTTSRTPLSTNPSRYSWNPRPSQGEKEQQEGSSWSGALNQKGKACESCRICMNIEGIEWGTTRRSSDGVCSVKAPKVDHLTMLCLHMREQSNGNITTSGSSPDACWRESTGLFFISWPCMFLSNMEIYLCTQTWSSGCDSSWTLDNFLSCIHIGLSSLCAGTVIRWRFLRPSQKGTDITCVCVLIFLNIKEFPPVKRRGWSFVKICEKHHSNKQANTSLWNQR